MNLLKKLSATITVVSGVVFMFVLAFHTPREGRGPRAAANEECQLPDSCVARPVARLDDPAEVFDPIPADTSVADSSGPTNVNETARA